MSSSDDKDDVIIIAHIGAGYFNEKHADMLKALVALSLESAQREDIYARKMANADPNHAEGNNMDCGVKKKGDSMPNTSSSLEICSGMLLRASKILEESELTNTGYGSSITDECSVFCDSSVCGYNMETMKRCQNSIIMNSSRLPLRDAVDGLLYTNKHVTQSENLAITPSIVKIGNIKADLDLVSPRMKLLYNKYRTHIKQNRSITSVPNKEDDDQTKTHTIQDTIGVSVILPNRYALTGASSGGNMLKPSGRVGCAGIVGAGAFSTGNSRCTVTVMCSGNGEDIIQMDLARSVGEYLVDNVDKVTESPVCELVANHVYEQSKKCDLLAVDDSGNHVLYVGVVGYMEWVEETRKSRLFFYFHTTPTMVFGVRSRVDRRTYERCLFSRVRANRRDARGEFALL